eukprot:13792976-Alexandrium_andersonii.AAC.1
MLASMQGRCPEGPRQPEGPRLTYVRSPQPLRTPYTLTARAPPCARSTCPSRPCTSPTAAQPWWA